MIDCAVFFLISFITCVLGWKFTRAPGQSVPVRRVLSTDSLRKQVVVSHLSCLIITIAGLAVLVVPALQFGQAAYSEASKVFILGLAVVPLFLFALAFFYFVEDFLREDGQ